MSTLGNILGTAGTPHTFEHRGKVFAVSLLTQAVKQSFEQALFERARAVLIADKEHYTSEQFVARLDALNEQYLAGDYDFVGGKICARALGTAGGALILARLLLGASEEEVFSILLERGAELKAMLRLVLAQSSPDIAQRIEEEEPAGPNA